MKNTLYILCTDRYNLDGRVNATILGQQRRVNEGKVSALFSRNVGCCALLKYIGSGGGRDECIKTKPNHCLLKNVALDSNYSLAFRHRHLDISGCIDILVGI